MGMRPLSYTVPLWSTLDRLKAAQHAEVPCGHTNLLAGVDCWLRPPDTSVLHVLPQMSTLVATHQRQDQSC